MSDILVIGAAVGQLPLIRKIQTMGHRALVVSRPGPYPGFDEADEAIILDIGDWDAIREVARDRNVSAVVTDQSDVCLPTVVAIAEDLGLPTVPSAVVSLFDNKQQLGAWCREKGIVTPGSHEVRTPSELTEAAKRVGCPFVLKPVDGNGSQGVQLVRDTAELEKVYKESRHFSRSGVLLAEQYVTGIEIVVEALVYNGRVVNLAAGISENISIDGRFIPSARLFPAALPSEILGPVYEANVRLYEGHGKFFSIVQAEYILSMKENQPYLIDAHTRGGGAFISSHIVPLVTGVDLYDLYVRWACREQIELPDRVALHRHAGYVCFVLPEGHLLNTVDSEAIARLPGVEYCNLRGLSPGTRLAAPKDKRSRFGPIVIGAESAEGLEHVRRLVEQGVRLCVQTRDGIAGPLWH